MSQENVEVIRRAYAAFANEGVEGVIPFFTGGRLVELTGQTKGSAVPMRMQIGKVFSGFTDGRIARQRLFSSWEAALSGRAAGVAGSGRLASEARG